MTSSADVISSNSTETLRRGLVTSLGCAHDPRAIQCRDKLVPLRLGDKMYNTNVTWADLDNCATYFTFKNIATSYSQSSQA